MTAAKLDSLVRRVALDASDLARTGHAVRLWFRPAHGAQWGALAATSGDRAPPQPRDVLGLPAWLPMLSGPIPDSWPFSHYGDRIGALAASLPLAPSAPAG